MTVHTDKNLDNLSLMEAADLEESDQEKSLRWLLEMDLSEPEEKLFTVSGNDYLDAGLSAFEAEVAGRPLVRGNAGRDDLASYVEEEIVMSSAGSGADIYNQQKGSGAVESVRDARREAMTVDFSLRPEHGQPALRGHVEEGADILGLDGDDDIGEKFVSIKRVKTQLGGNIEHSGSKRMTREIGDSFLQAVDTSRPPFEHIGLVSDAGAGIEIENEIENEEVLLAAPDYANVRDFAATIPPSADDDEFDGYLLAGGHLPEGNSDPEELVLQPSEGVIAVDPSTDTTIDYHEDFRGMAGFEENSASTIAAVITPIMEAISGAVQVRLQDLACAADAVVVDVRIGSDEQAVRQCVAQGYAPATAVCPQLPQPLVAVSAAIRDSIYVRFWNTQLNTSWNALFGLDFVASVEPVDGSVEHSVEYSIEKPDEMCSATASFEPDFSDALVAENTVLAESAIVPEAMLVDGFGEDLFDDGFADDFSAQLPDAGAVAAYDIEAFFADLSQFQESPDEICGVGFDAFESHDAETSVTEPEQAVPAQTLVGDSAFLAEHTAENGCSMQEAEAVPSRQFSTQPSAQPLQDKSQTGIQDTDASAFDGTCLDGFVPDYITFSYSTQSNNEIFTDFVDAFIEEGSAEVEKLENEVGEWEKSVASEPLFAKVSRTLHTIKGIAKGVGLHRLGTLVHNFETLLEKMPRPNAGQEQAYFRIVNAWLDALVRGVGHVSDLRADIASEFPVPVGSNATPQQVEESVELPETEDAALRQVAAKVISEEFKPAMVSALEKKRDQQLADEGAKALAAQQSVRITSEKLDHLLNLTSQAQQLGVRASQNTKRSKRSSAELQARLSSVRTHIRKIADRALLDVNARPGSASQDMDALEMDQYSELQEAANILREGVEDLADLVEVVSRQNMQIETLLKQQSSVISGISSSIQGARVVPVSRLMPGLRRIVRTVSTDLGKIVSFKALNETGALDRDHYARLQVVLEHMVRNALDHGIETPEERMSMGKPTAGRITIDVRKSGGDYLIRLADDGRGIDPDAIRESAYEKGLDVDVDALSDEEAIRLIFHKGFSTATAVSEISGRGVGMDIVLTELQQIGGDVQIQSTIGLGTAFEVRIPSNVSVNGALLVRAAGESYAIPLNGLVAVEQVPVEDFFAAIEDRGTVSVSDLPCEPTYLATLCQGLGLPDRSIWGKYVPVIVAGSADRYMAIAIDTLEEALELVVRSLGSQFSTVPGLAGAATTAEGEAIVALDLNLMVSVAGADGIAPVSARQSKVETLMALVVDDSRTQRMVATSQLDTVGVETVTAENGLVAIDLLNATHRLPDIILLDVEMPVKDGIQTLREIRKSKRYGHLPVIMVTSRTGAKHRALASEAGCSAYMGKPFNFPELVRQINELTGHDLQLS